MLSPLFVTSGIQLLWFKENTNFLRRHKYYTHGLQCSKLSTNIKYKKYPTTIALTTGFRFIDRDQITDHQVLICSDDVKMSLQSCFSRNASRHTPTGCDKWPPLPELVLLRVSRCFYPSLTVSLCHGCVDLFPPSCIRASSAFTLQEDAGSAAAS